MQKRKQKENELERTQKQRLEEVRESEKKVCKIYFLLFWQKEECINLKEQYRIGVIERLNRLEKRSCGFRSFLASVGMHIPEADYEVSFTPKLQPTSYMIEYHNCILKIDSYTENISLSVWLLQC